MDISAISGTLVPPLAVGVAAAAAVPAYLGASRLAAWIATAPARRRIPPRDDARAVTLTTADGLRLAAWCFEPEGPARGTVVLGHGYRDDRRQLIALVPALRARGLRALAFDFRAHGASEGTCITLGPDEARDVAAALDWAAAQGGAVAYVGFSMGAAAYLLAGREADAAVLDSPYDTLREAVGARLDFLRIPRAAGAAMVRFGAVRACVDVDRVCPIDAVPRLARPTLLVFAPRDPWLPPATRQRFRAALPAVCAMCELAEGGHADHFSTVWVERVAAFLTEHC